MNSNMILARCTASVVAPALVSFISCQNICSVSRFEMCEKDSLCAEVIPVNILKDNFSYLIRDRESGETACVDPADAGRVLKVAKKKRYAISKAFVTHKHWDHSGGNKNMVKKIKGLEVISSAKEDDVPETTKKLSDGETVKLGSLTVRALHTPCHTRGHVLYYVTGAEGNGGHPILFTGDTLFVGGCGRFFEGDGADMYKAVNIINSLPSETRIFCGHEYTVANLKFAQSIEPDNKDIADKLEWAKKTTIEGDCTVPSTIADERKTNPFMRTDVPEVQKKTATVGDPIATMAALRTLKDEL